MRGGRGSHEVGLARIIVCACCSPRGTRQAVGQIQPGRYRYQVYEIIFYYFAKKVESSDHSVAAPYTRN